MSSEHDREMGSTDARLDALEQRMGKLEMQNSEMLKVLYMGRGILWLGGAIAALAALWATALEIIRQLRGV